MAATARFTAPGNQAQVLDLVEGALRASGLQIASTRRDGARLLAQTRASLRSWGEEITAEVSGGVLTVTSYPRSQAFDWGKSADNLERLGRQLETLGLARV